MKHAQHTPGPWIQEIDTVFIGDNRKCQPVAYHMDAEGIANARLIAAAPDLLAALQGARAALRRALPHCPPDDAGLFVGEWLDEIKAVIAKASLTSED